MRAAGCRATGEGRDSLHRGFGELSSRRCTTVPVVARGVSLLAPLAWFKPRPEESRRPGLLPHFLICPPSDITVSVGVGVSPIAKHFFYWNSNLNRQNTHTQRETRNILTLLLKHLPTV